MSQVLMLAVLLPNDALNAADLPDVVYRVGVGVWDHHACGWQPMQQLMVVCRAQRVGTHRHAVL